MLRKSILGSMLMLLFGFISFAQNSTNEIIQVHYGEGINEYTLSNSLLVQFDDQLSEEDKSSLLRTINGIIEVTHIPSPKVTVAYFKNADPEQLMQVLEALPSVEYVSQGLIYKDGTPEYPLNSVYVQLKSSEQLTLLSIISKAVGAEVIEEGFMPNLIEVQFDKDSKVTPLSFAEGLNKRNDFKWAETDMLKFLQKLSTNDPFIGSQWSLNNTGSYFGGTSGEDMEVFNAWTLTTGSSSIKVAILDEGVDLDHPDLVGNMLAGFDGHGITAGDAINDDAHGTACAAIVAAVGNNNLGTAGVAYDSKIIPVRIAYSQYDPGLGRDIWITSSSIIGSCITWSWQTAGADVLSNSWGGGANSSLVNNPISNSVSLGRSGLGAPVLFAAGNDDGPVGYPATQTDAISVAAMSMCAERKSPSSCDGESWWGSNYGTGLDVAAPGVKVYAADIAGADGYNSGDYTGTFNGTSSACPNAAGVMALILSANPGLTESQARDILESTTDKAGSYTYTGGYPNGTWTNELGYGRVNAYSAVQAALASTSNCPFAATLGVFGVGIGTATVYLTNSSAITPNYLVEYGPSGFTPGSGTLISTTNDTTILSGLLSNTTYSFYYYLDCGADTSFALSGPSFTTPCGSVVAPFTQDFSGLTLGWNMNYGQCWTTDGTSTNPRWEVEDASGSNENSSSTGPFYDNTSFGSAGGKYAFLETSSPSGTGDSARIYSPLIDVSGLTTPFLDFYYHMYGSTMGSLHVDVHDGNGWNRSVVSFNGQQHLLGSDPWSNATATLSGYGPIIQLRFRGMAGSSFYSDMSIDDISIAEAPSCPDPVITSAIVGASSINITWTGGTLPNDYNVALVQDGNSLNAGIIGFTSLNQIQYSFSVLQANTTYTFYVRDSCGVGDVSNWATTSFTTPCAAENLPYSEDFDSWAPACWDLDDGTQIVGQASGGDYMEGNFWTWTAGQTGIARSPFVDISTDARVSFKWAHLYSTTYPNDRMLLLARVSGSANWDTLVDRSGPTFNSPNAQNSSPPTDGDFVTDSVDLPASMVGQVVEFQFNFNSGWGPDVYVDDFEVKSTLATPPTCFPIDSVNIVNLPQGVFRAYWSPLPDSATGYTLEWRAKGEATWRSKSVNNPNILNQKFNITPWFNDSVEYRLGVVVNATTTWGCTSTMLVPCRPMTISTAEQKGATCLGDSALLRVGYAGGRGPKTILWSNGITVKRTYADQGESLSVTVTDETGCSVSDTITASILSGTAEAPTNASTTRSGALVTVNWNAASLGAGQSVIGYRVNYRLRFSGNPWTVSSLTSNTNMVIDMTNEPTGNYEFAVVTRYNDIGTPTTSSRSCFTVRGWPGISSKRGNSSGIDGAAIYPNPTNDIVHIEGPAGSTIQLTDLQGKVLANAQITDGEVQFDLSQFAQGVYLIRISSGDETWVERLVKN